MLESYTIHKSKRGKYMIQCALVMDDGFIVHGYSKQFLGIVEPMAPECYERRKAAYQAAAQNANLIKRYKEYTKGLV